MMAARSRLSGLGGLKSAARQVTWRHASKLTPIPRLTAIVGSFQRPGKAVIAIIARPENSGQTEAIDRHPSAVPQGIRDVPRPGPDLRRETWHREQPGGPEVRPVDFRE